MSVTKGAEVLEVDTTDTSPEECAERIQSERVPQKVLYDAWKAWCPDNGVRPTAKASFTRRLSELGHSEVKSNGQRFYAGLKMNLVGLIQPPA